MSTSLAIQPAGATAGPYSWGSVLGSSGARNCATIALGLATAGVPVSLIDFQTNATSTCNVPTGTADNDVMIAVAKYSRISAFPGYSPIVSDPPAGWTMLLNSWQTYGDDDYRICYKVAASEPASYTFVDSTNLVLSSFRDVDNGSPINAFDSTEYGASGGTIFSPAVTPSAQAAVLVTWHRQSLSSSTPPTADGCVMLYNFTPSFAIELAMDAALAPPGEWTVGYLPL